MVAFIREHVYTLEYNKWMVRAGRGLRSAPSAEDVMLPRDT